MAGQGTLSILILVLDHAGKTVGHFDSNFSYFSQDTLQKYLLEIYPFAELRVFSFNNLVEVSCVASIG